MEQNIEKLCQDAVQASRILAQASTHQKNQALQAIADAVLQNKNEILNINQQEVEFCRQKGKNSAFLDRLALNIRSIESAAKGLENIADLPDPVGSVIADWKRPNGLLISRVRVPLGVIGVIYEARPGVTVDASGLCLKSGNAVILRGGSESFKTSQAFMNCIKQGLNAAGLPATSVQMLATPHRSAVDELLQMDRYIDVIIPRGGPSLIEHVSKVSKIPQFKHLAGNCHTYLHHSADPEMAATVILNAKMRRTGICGATEKVLIDRDALENILPSVINVLTQAGCEIRGDQEICRLYPEVKPATDQDWDTEYLDSIIAIKVVSGIEEAVKHIAEHGTQHTEAIIARDQEASGKFLKQVDSAIVMHNTSTQFADGGEFGMGAEIGIATGKLHARGPVGVEQLTTFKYQVRGDGQIRPL